MKIFAHRGFSHKFPEGSRAAYEGAVNAGADGFECDVRLIRGGEIICFHDRTTRRLTGKTRLISRMTAEEIKEIYDAITLQELLEIAIKEKKYLLIETKHPVISGGKIEKRVIELLNEKSSEIKSAGIEITLMSFSYLAVMRMKRRYPNVAKVIKYTLAVLLSRQQQVAINIEVLRKHPSLLNRTTASKIFLWTVNSQSDLRWLANKSVDGVITDRVTRARKIMGC
jgi:glycerophosphoryl diester phosphodiesterase